MIETVEIKVVVVDDHPIVRAGIVALLSEQPGILVIGQSGDGIDAIELVARLAPDVLLLDLMLPGLSGFEVARRVARSHPSTRVLVLTLHANDAYAVQVLSEGAAGFLLKDAHPDEILRALRVVSSGGRHFPARLKETRDAREASDPWTLLTDREREVAQLAGEGHSSADIGARLGISARTVEVHRGNVLRKLRLSGIPGLVRFLICRGILSSVD